MHYIIVYYIIYIYIYYFSCRTFIVIIVIYNITIVVVFQGVPWQNIRMQSPKHLISMYTFIKYGTVCIVHVCLKSILFLIRSFCAKVQTEKKCEQNMSTVLIIYYILNLKTDYELW